MLIIEDAQARQRDQAAQRDPTLAMNDGPGNAAYQRMRQQLAQVQEAERHRGRRRR